MRFLLRIASRSARLRAAGQRARRGLSRAIDANGAGLLRQTRADRGDARWCAAPTPSSSPRPTRRRRACRSRVCCVRRAIRPRARNRRRRRAAFFKKRCCLVLAREMMLRGVNVEREKNCASCRCRCCCAGIRSVDLEFRQRYRSSTRDRSRSQTPIPPESARDRRVVWKQKKRSLSLRILRL
jgi:hypothetical protein